MFLSPNVVFDSVPCKLAGGQLRSGLLVLRDSSADSSMRLNLKFFLSNSFSLKTKLNRYRYFLSFAANACATNNPLLSDVLNSLCPCCWMSRLSSAA